MLLIQKSRNRICGQVSWDLPSKTDHRSSGNFRLTVLKRGKPATVAGVIVFLLKILLM